MLNKNNINNIKFTNSNFSIKRNNKGFALLMATLVSGLFLSISAAIFQIAYLQLILSSVGRDSQFAFYAADTGAECALYWDRNYTGGDGSGSAFSIYNNGGPDDQSNQRRLISGLDPMIQCGGGNVSGPFKQGGFPPAGGIHQTYFKIDSGSTCAEVVVTKYSTTNPDIAATPDDATISRTIITSRGYNTCNTTSDRRVERAVQITIQ